MSKYFPLFQWKGVGGCSFVRSQEGRNFHLFNLFFSPSFSFFHKPKAQHPQNENDATENRTERVIMIFPPSSSMRGEGAAVFGERVEESGAYCPEQQLNHYQIRDRRDHSGVENRTHQSP